jgi:hypothetical protein
MKLNKFTINCLLLLLLAGCGDADVNQNIAAYKPVYGTIDNIQSFIKTTAPQPLRSVGKIYTYNNLLLINEVGKGIHVYDNQDPTSPINSKFISIPGNIDVALKDGYLYADLNAGVVTLDISNLDSVKVTHINTEYKGENLQNNPSQSMLNTRPSGKVYYECPDASKGQILTWELATIPKPVCYMNN